MKYTLTLLLASLLFTWSCQSGMQKKSVGVLAEKPNSLAAELLAKALATHGGKKYDQAHYSFEFRKKTYTFSNNGTDYRYTLSRTKDGQKIVDILDNAHFSRSINGTKVALTEKEVVGYTGALNSVIYFATLPHKLQDPAVNIAYAGTTSIAGKNYEMLEVTFEEEGGGRDHDDQFLYWINQASHTIDFLAYNYQVNNGGVRFRSAYNTRNVDGILFQDYVNYKAPVGTPLKALPALFEKEALKKLSVIETENVVRLKK